MGTNSNSGDRRGKLISGAVVAIVALIGAGLFLTNYFGKEERNPLTGCKIAKAGGATLSPVRQTAILVDQSEEIPEPQKLLVRQYVARLLADEVKQDDRVLLFTFSRMETGSLIPKVEVCKPKESANEFIETRWRIGARLRLRFYIPLLEALNHAVENVGPPPQDSPIFEAIQGVVPHVHAWPESRTLLVISDMLQHRPPYTHYRKLPDNEFEVLLRSRDKVSFLASLQGWSVKVLYLSRRDPKGNQLPYQDANHLKFWHEYFQAAGVKVGSIEFERI